MTSKTGQIRIGIGGWTFAPWRGIVLSEGPAAREGTRLRRRAAHLDRGQRHVLPHPVAGDLPQVGERSARRLRVLAEGLALRHQPPRAQGGGRLDQAVSGFRRDRARRRSSAPCSGNSRRSRNSTRPTSAASSNCCRTRSTAITCGMSSRCGTTASSTPEFIALLRKFSMPVVFTDHVELSQHRRRHRRLRLCAAAAGQGHGADRLSAEGDRRLGRPADRLGEGRRAGRPRPRRRRPARKAKPRDVFAYVIHEGKVRAPAAAMALIERLK